MAAAGHGDARSGLRHDVGARDPRTHQRSGGDAGRQSRISQPPAHQIWSAVRRSHGPLEVQSMASDQGPRYLVDSYREWACGERIPFIEGIALDLNTIETEP